MTILGVHACSAARGVVWADSELYYRGLPTGGCDKISVNRYLGLVGVGSGRDAALRTVDSYVSAAVSLDLLLERLPAVLRRADWKFPGGERMNADYAVCGFDRRVRRVVAYAFSSADNFEQRAVRGFCLPDVRGAPYAETADDVISAAQDQIAVLRRQLPSAVGGVLTMAVVTEAGIVRRRIWDFSRRCMLSQPAAAA